MKGTALVLGFVLTVASTFTHADFWSETRDHTVETIRHPERTIRNAGRTIRNNPIGVAVNPGQLVNFTGIPTPGDLAEITVNRPEDLDDYLRHPENLVGAPLYAALNTARNRALSGRTHRIPPAVRAQLAPYFPPGRLDNVVWTSDWGVFNGITPTIAMACGAYAITLDDVIVFRDSNLAQSPVLWAHELTHVDQYQRWGMPTFARKYTAHSSSVESEAYGRENQIRSALTQPRNPPFQVAMGGPGVRWTAFCATPNFGCQLPRPQPAGTACGCYDNRRNLWSGMAR